MFKPVNDLNLLGNTTAIPGDAGHPLSGYRQFGVTPNSNGGFVFYTRGVDRAYGLEMHSSKLQFLELLLSCGER